MRTATVTYAASMHSRYLSTRPYAAQMHRRWQQRYAIEDQATVRPAAAPVSPRVSLSPSPAAAFIPPHEVKPTRWLTVEKPLAEWHSRLPGGNDLLHHEVHLHEGLHAGAPVYRWNDVHAHTGDELATGDWTHDRAEAEAEGLRHAATRKLYPTVVPDMPAHPVRQAMMAGNEAHRVKLDRGVNGAHVLTLDNGQEGIWKPERSEDHDLRATVPGGYWRREVAASEAADALGLDDLVPKTVARHHEGEGWGSYQDFVPNARNAAHYGEESAYDGPDDLARAAAFDYLTGNSDRHHNNWMLRATPEGKLKLALIDNGLAFPNHPHGEYGGPTALLEQAIRRNLPIPPEVAAWARKKDDVRHALERNGLSRSEVDHTMRRLQHLAQAAENRQTLADLARASTSQHLRDVAPVLSSSQSPVINPDVPTRRLPEAVQ